MTLSNGCNSEFQLEKSILKARFLLLLNLFTVFVTVTSGLSWLMKLALVLALGVSFFVEMKGKSSQLQGIKFKDKQWQLLFADGKHQNYTQCRTVLDSGIFMVLQLTDGKKRRRYLLFSDQLNSEALRKLYVLQQLK